LAALLASVVLAAACGGDDAPDGDAGSIAGVGGRVLVTLDGPLVGADVSIDHLDFQGATPMVNVHVGDVTTDGTGYFHIGTGTKSGYFLITTRGGQFKDYATGQAIVLDATDELTAILYTDSLEDLTTGLVTPIAHLAHKLIVARTAAGTDATLIASHALVNEHLDAHFGGLAWERGTVGDLSVAAPSPTADVRAAFILAAWSLIAQDIATAAGSTAQEINPYTLAIDLGRDLGAPPFDGNDANERASGTGVQFGACPAAPGACVPMGTCDLGDCRSKCDAYANTTRTVLATWLANVINDSEHNQTGLTSADTLSFVRAVASNADPVLFGAACVDVEGVDLEPPTFTWGATPADGAVVRGAATWTVAASDNVDPAPVVTWLGGLPDTDGAPSGAATTIDTTLAADGPRSVTAHAVDESGNADETRMIVADNTAPALTVDSDGFLPDASTWWTALDAPHLTGTVTDAHGPITVEARILGAVVASATFPSGAWDLALPAGSIVAAGSTVVVRAVDAVGNATVDSAATSPFLRVDSAAPTLTWESTTAGLTLLGADYWATTATPTLSGTVTDANLASVIASWPGGSATATVAGTAWSVLLPGLDLAGRDVTITATDRAGNTAVLVRHLRADTTPPVAGFGTTTVMKEDGDTLDFSSTIVGGLRTYNPQHNHATAAAVTLGPATACDASAPSVVKFAYLLDESPPYATESGGGPTDGGKNPLKWQLDPADDGVGLASARYRVVRVDTGALVINWVTLAAPTPTLVRLYRNGTAGAVALGAAQGLLRIDFEATDRLMRTVAASRCWNQKLLPAPITIGTAGAATTATAGKLALAGLNLSTAGSPVSSMTNILNGGAGLYEFPIYNPTRETVYLSIDVSRTMAGRYATTFYSGKWIYRDVTTNYDCGAVGSAGDWEPDLSRPNCDNAAPPPGNSMLQRSGMDPLPILATDYSVRMWAGTDDVASTLTELTQCAGCSVTPAGADPRTRITVAIPPRGAADAPPVKVWIMPTLRPSTNYQPGGSATEFSGAGLELTGASTSTFNQCVQWNLPIPYTFAAQPTYRCTRTRQFQQVRYLKSIAITSIGQLNSYAFTGLDGASTVQPEHLPGTDNRKQYTVQEPAWNTIEATEPPSL
jgi:hypothetical protein